jgi:hypothetical protein
MRECKLRSAVNWQGALKQKGIQQTGIKQGLGVLVSCLYMYSTQQFSLFPARAIKFVWWGTVEGVVTL